MMEITVNANAIRGGVSHPPVLAHMFYRRKIAALQDCTGTCVMCVGACELYCKDKFAVLPQNSYPSCRLAREVVVMRGALGNLRGSCPVHITTTIQRTSVRESPVCIKSMHAHCNMV